MPSKPSELAETVLEFHAGAMSGPHPCECEECAVARAYLRLREATNELRTSRNHGAFGYYFRATDKLFAVMDSLEISNEATTARPA